MRKSINFPSMIANISLAEKLVDEVSEAYHLTAELYGNILVSIIEAVNNAIKHGNKYNSEKSVTVEYEISGKYLIFTVTDEGHGFDYRHVPDPTTHENIEKTNGRGIFLINNLADAVSFYHGGAQVEMKFKIK